MRHFNFQSSVQMIFWLPLILCCSLRTTAQISLTTFGGPGVSQNFNTLANTGTSSVLPAGWVFVESGTNANEIYTAGTGSGTAGDTYSFGTGTNTERALGGLQSGSLVPTFGASFINNTGATIAGIAIQYRGEQWRLGATGRVDRLDFEYSLDATSLTNGTWVSVDNLDFTAPVTMGTVGALVGNNAPNFTVINGHFEDINIPNGAVFWIRWNDFNSTGADDGLSVDDFSIKACPVVEAGAYGPLCVNDPNITLNGMPTGGVWTGIGVSGNTFDPSAGTQTLRYTYNSGGCMTSDLVTIVVNPCIMPPEMRWVLLNEMGQQNGTCTSTTNCDLNRICFGLQYTPNVTGTLTSYTTGFFVNCVNGGDPVVSNSSCVMTNSSLVQNACAQVGLLLWNFSGQNGTTAVQQGVPKVVHQVCFNVPPGNIITLEEDADFSNLTTSLDTPNGPVSEEPFYTTFTINGPLYCALLPVTWLDFQAEKLNEKSSLLTWSTKEEISNSHFEVQRSSDRGMTFETIGRVETSRSTAEIKHYQYVDQHPAPGVNFYRISQVDLDGQSSLSPIRSLQFASPDFAVQAWPNPVQDELSIFINRATAPGQFHLVDMSGRLMIQRHFEQGDSTIGLDMTTFPPGVYHLMVTAGNDVHSERVVVVK